MRREEEESWDIQVLWYVVFFVCSVWGRSWCLDRDYCYNSFRFLFSALLTCISCGSSSSKGWQSLMCSAFTACSSLTAITSLIGWGIACHWSGHGGLHNLIILVHWQAILKMSYGRCCDHKSVPLQSSIIPIPSAPARLFPPSQRYEPLEKYPNSPIPQVFPYFQFPLLFGNKRSWVHRVNLESLSLHSSLDFILCRL